MDDLFVLSEEHCHYLPKPGGKSEVWKFFGLRKDAEGMAIDDGTVFCKSCNRAVVARNGNTSNLRAHLKNNHKSLYNQLGQGSSGKQVAVTERQEPIVNSILRSQPYGHQSKRYKDLNTAIARFLCKDGLPIYTVEKEGFKELIRTLDSRYELPNRSHFTRNIIPELYSSTKEKVARRLCSVKYFAATTDIWSSIGLTPYISYTLHHITQDWDLESIALSISFLPDDHTAEVISDALEDTLQEWKLSAVKQVCLTTDSAANMVSAARNLGLTRISCFGHNLHLGITKALDKDRRCDRAIGVAKKIVSHFSCSWKKRRDLTLAQDVKTRWGTTQKMIARILEQQQAITFVLSSDRKSSHLIPSWQDIDVWGAINEALSPLADFTDIMSGEKYVTGSSILPILSLLKSSVLKANPNDKPMANEIRSAILSDLSNRYVEPEVTTILELTSMIDPRFKEKHVSNLKEVKSNICEEAVKIFKEETEQPTEPSELTSSTPSASTDSLPPPAKKKKVTLATLFKEHNSDIADSLCLDISPEQKVQAELTNYLRQPKSDIEKNPLKWWREHKTVYPLLSGVARKYLCFPATSTPSERLFSRSGRIVTPFRASLKPDTVQQLVFLSANLDL
ncbi:PREDICTED: zinc finger BED domain-containing protein 1-like [Amphimedon queenslandica]|uniref:BED-type domain-containing protein n=1 Tax=Amphimedon queenslandica TaxID=400682 RepID=A0AAN0ISN7_AMPQE|nr:PREDICTED: zinc finger BED domain-containing protein 1-like [Amphimedon queenslandica]|eukprot:XP_011408230.1 PREDICTED: zinc finger BED domain-containing protein 1-like [Amphimedon queenslandica]